MDISTTQIFSSAESLIRNKAKWNNKKPNKAESEQETNDSISFSSIIDSRFLYLQKELADFQKLYTREQSRLSLLDSELTDSELVTFLFDKELLFPEGLEELTNEKEEILYTTQARKELIYDQIRAIEIELENLFSVSKEKEIENLKDIEVNTDALKTIDSKIVAKLVKD
jgi:hypothetical protein